MAASDKPKQRRILGIRPDARQDAQAPTRAPVRGRHLPGTAKTRTRADQEARHAGDRTPPRQPAGTDDSRRGKPGSRRAPDTSPKDAKKRPAPTTAPGGPGPGRASARNRQAQDQTRRTRPALKPAPAQAFFVPCPKGLEAELVNELMEIGLADVRPAPGGAAVRGSLQDAWRVNLWSRLAVKVLWRVGEGRYRQESDLYDGARQVDWPGLFEVYRSFAVHAVARRSPLKSLNFAALKIKDGLCDRFRAELGERPSVDTRNPEVPLVLYLSEERYSLYVDLSGEPLNRRGFRVEPAPAPLNENLAAGLLRLAGWRPGMPFFDPMMGGGTLLIEAAMMWLNRAPGLQRHFAFEHLKNFQPREWQRLRQEAEAAAHAPEPLPIFGSDNDPAMVQAASRNLQAAGLLDCVQLLEADFLEVDAPPTQPGIIVSNPPYGVRLSLEDNAAFYRALGDTLKQRYAGWSAHFISADTELPKHIGLSAHRRTPLFNGPLECRFYAFRIVAGSNRPRK